MNYLIQNDHNHAYILNWDLNEWLLHMGVLKAQYSRDTVIWLHDPSDS